MLSKSLGAARTAVRDLFRSADDRRDKKHWWSEPASEWGLNAARVQSSTIETSDDTFVTTQSFQSNLTDLPTPSIDHAIIKEGPRRWVPDVQRGPVVEEAYSVLERVPGFEVAMMNDGVERDEDCGMYFERFERVNFHARDGDEVYGLEERLGSTEKSWILTPSVLFAYRAMNVNQGAAQSRHQSTFHEFSSSPHRQSANEAEMANLHQRNDDAISYSAMFQNEDATHRDILFHTKQGHCRPKIMDTGSYLGADFTDIYDISDDEGDLQRISPSTFRRWAAGCAQRETTYLDELYVPIPIDKDADASTDVLENAATPLAEQSSIETSDSDSDSLARSKWNHILTWQRKMPCPPTETSPLPSGQVITLTNDDILAALSHPSAPPCLAHIPLPSIQSALQTRYQLLLNSQNLETQLQDMKREALARVSSSHEEEVDVKDETEWERERRMSIYRHVEGHLGDVAELYDASQARVRGLADEVCGLAERRWRKGERGV